MMDAAALTAGPIASSGRSIYGPGPRAFDRSWKPGDFEEVAA
jgi:hypothetical protein